MAKPIPQMTYRTALELWWVIPAVALGGFLLYVLADLIIGKYLE